MAEVGGLAILVMLVVAIGGPIAVLVVGSRTVKWALIGLFVSASLGLPAAAMSDPPEFRGTALIMAVLLFVIGLVAINVVGAIRKAA